MSIVCVGTLLLCGLAGAAAVFDQEIHNKYKTLPRHEFIRYFNALNLSWSITHHQHLEGKNLACVVNSKDREDVSIPEKFVGEKAFDLPENFDARERWPHCETIKEIYDQDKGGLACGSCWTFGTATTASDRTCIHTGRTVRLAPQDLQCCNDCFDTVVCGGGEPLQAFQFWRDSGLVTERCKPYDVCELRTAVCKTTCKDRALHYEEDKHYGHEVYKVPSDDDAIRAELAHNGPVEAELVVYEDFAYHYQGGVYEHKFGDKLSNHSVRVVGYGVEDGVEYWLGANSWGSWWGDKGFFKIKRFQEAIQFEAKIMTGIPRK